MDKSILIRTESNGAVRFRLLETLRDYGRERIDADRRNTTELRRRHADWYRRLVRDAAADWFSPRQVDWMQRLEREGLNIRAALEFSLTDSPETALEIAGTVHPFGLARGALTETRRWLDRALDAAPPRRPTRPDRRALRRAMVAALQGDLPAATARVAEGRILVEQMTDPEAHGMVTIADGFTALVSGEFDRACARFEDALDAVDDPDAAGRGDDVAGMGPGVRRRDRSGAHLAGESARACRNPAASRCIEDMRCGRWELAGGGIGKPDRAAELLNDALQVT